MLRRLLLIRHAETATPDRFHGAESDVGLGPPGLLQAATLARALRPLPIQTVICSGMLRARQTATPLAIARGTLLTIVPALHERKMPSLSGLPKADGWDAYLATMDRWMTGDVSYAADAGDESYEALRARLLPSITQAIDECTGPVAAFILHGLVIRTLLTSLVEGLGVVDYGRLGIDNCAVNDLRRSGTTWHADALNCPAADLRR